MGFTATCPPLTCDSDGVADGKDCDDNALYYRREGTRWVDATTGAYETTCYESCNADCDFRQCDDSCDASCDSGCHNGCDRSCDELCDSDCKHGCSCDMVRRRMDMVARGFEGIGLGAKR